MDRYTTSDGDMVDSIAWRYYGATTPEVLRAVLDANPGLAARGPLLPAGVTVMLPALPTSSGEAKSVALWD